MKKRDRIFNKYIIKIRRRKFVANRILTQGGTYLKTENGKYVIKSGS